MSNLGRLTPLQGYHLTLRCTLSRQRRLFNYLYTVHDEGSDGRNTGHLKNKSRNACAKIINRDVRTNGHIDKGVSLYRNEK